MTARQKHIRLLEQLLKSPNKISIRQAMDKLMQTTFESCFVCKLEFTHKQFVDEITPSEQIICPNCRA